MAKPALQLQVGQQLSLTPQLQQAIRLLALSTVELQTEIREQLESNPLLERSEYREDEPAGDGADGERDSAADGADDTVPVETADDAYLTQPARGPAPADGADRQPEGDSNSQWDLHEHLLWQLNLSQLSDKDHAIAEVLIDAVDDSGYLSDSVGTVREALRPEIDAEPAEIEAVLHRVQRFDPLGVAARDLSECLGVQLSALPAKTPGLATANAIAENHLDALARNDEPALLKALGLTPDTLYDGVALIRSLEPRPGSAIAPAATEYVIPDVYVVQRHGEWRIQLNPQALPRLCINGTYAGMIDKVDKADASYLRGHLQEARWLLRSIETRNETLVNVARAIVSAQQAFFEHGEEAMKPMVLREIAEAVDLHESTISRVTTRKYMHTPRGVFEFKYFFSSHVGTNDGGEASATAIQAMIRRLVDEEPPGKPLSDSKLQRLLDDQGIAAARRTVAKYREALGIPSSTERRRQAKSAFSRKPSVH